MHELMMVAAGLEAAGRADAAAELRELALLLAGVPGPVLRAGLDLASKAPARTADEALRAAPLAEVAVELGRLGVPMGDLRGAVEAWRELARGLVVRFAEADGEERNRLRALLDVVQREHGHLADQLGRGW